MASCATGCSDGGAASPSTTTLVVPAPEAVEAVEAVAPLGRPVEPSEPGTLTVVLGALVDRTLSITQCEARDLDLEAGDTAPQVLLSVVARDGDEATVAVRRFAAPGESLTITETVTYAEGPEDTPTFVLQAQRFEVGGVVTDRRDPGAVGALIRRDGDQVRVDGVFAPPGSFADDGGLVAGAVSAHCP